MGMNTLSQQSILTSAHTNKMNTTERGVLVTEELHKLPWQ